MRDGTLGRMTRAVFALTVAMAGLALVGPGSIADPTEASAAPGDGVVTVRVVQEVNANGLVDSTIMEPPLAGVTVHVTDDQGNSVSDVTDDDGLVTFDLASSALVGGEYRIEADNPRPDFFHPAHAANGQEPGSDPITAADLEDAGNDKLSTTTEFVDVTEDTDAFVNMAFWYPDYYCQENATLCTASQPWTAEGFPGSPPGEKTLVSLNYQFDGNDSLLSTNADTGTVYGIAYDRANQRIFSAAYAKRGSPYGPGGPGAIYVTDLSGPDPTSHPLTGTTSQFATVPNPGVDNHDMATNMDYAFFDNVGTESLGDIDITSDGAYLFGVNMFDKTVFVYDLATDAYVDSYLIPDPGCGADWRPMGTGVGLDTAAYVGGVCSGQSAQDMDAMTAHVYTFDPATGAFGTQVLSETLTYERGRAFDSAPVCRGAIEDDLEGRWFSWIDAYPAGPNEQRANGCDNAGGTTTLNAFMAYPTPMLGDIVEETNGDLVMSFRDRFTDQMGSQATVQNAAGTYFEGGIPAAGGDIVRGCRLADGTFVLDPNLTGGDVLDPRALCTNNNDGIGDGGQPTTFREFYTGDWRIGDHDEAVYGGLALSRVEPSIVGNGMDSPGVIFTIGTAAVDRAGGLPTGALGEALDDGTVDNFGKGSGLADLEVLCDEAPIQIGNRVWLDTDNDGVQDPGEVPIAGVTVNLYDATGALIATTVTSEHGEYYFDQTLVDGGLLQDTDYVIRLDEPTDYEPGGPLFGTRLTVTDSGPDDELDSDGALGLDDYPETTVTTGGAGEDDHSLDFGFVLPSVSVGDFVWVDLDRDGVQDPDEPGIPDVTLTLTGPDGGPVTDVYGNPVGPVQTDENGRYVFPALPVLEDGESYTVTIDETSPALAPYVPTVSGVGDPADDSSTGSASSTADLMVDGAIDPTLDFGFVLPSVSVGDFVWVDTDRDGVQDPGEPGIPGVTLTLTGLDGGPVTDVFGNPVGPVQTDENGLYSFDDLPPLGDGESYTVTIDQTSPALAPYIPTVSGVGDPADDSSTGSASSTADLTTNGANDPTLDFGFVSPSVSVGDFVWVDTDRDGVQDPSEPGIPGVTLTLTGPDGGPVTDVFGNPVGPVQTDENGLYSFDDLPALAPGQSYTVTIDQTSPALAPYIPTVAGSGDRAEDSSTGSATSGDLVGDGDRDPTLDFGFVLPSVSIEGELWLDDDGDGIIDDGEAPLPGVLLQLTGPDGGPVTDVFGNVVAPVRSGPDGSYSFRDLPALGDGESYTVSIDLDDPRTQRALDGLELTTTSVVLTADDLTEDGDVASGLDFGFRTPTPDPTPIPTPTPDPTPTPTPTPQQGSLPRTGGDAVQLLVFALGLVVFGQVLIAGTRRRRIVGGR